YRRTPETEQTLGSITRQQACAFADAHYTPGNAVMVISGNLEPQAVQDAILKALGHVSKRDAVAAVAVPELPAAGRKLDAPAPIDDDALVVAWPLPSEPKLRARVRAIATIMAAEVDGHIRGKVSIVDRGDERAATIELRVLPSLDETFEHMRSGVERGIADTPLVFKPTGSRRFDGFLWNFVTQTAIAQLFGTFEDGGGRDAHLASYVLAGVDPGEALAGELEALRDLTREQAAAIAREQLGLARATVVHLRQAGGPKQGVQLALAPSIHDQGQRRDPPDPALARAPLADEISTNVFAGTRTRTLANGMQIVLLPLTSVPTVDVRLVFDSGSGDELAGKRGAATVAAYSLQPSFHDVTDLILLAASGSSFDREVDLDRTTFSVHGLDMHLDLLLTGLARIVRNGTYYTDARPVAAFRKLAKRIADDNGSLTDAWRVAVYGAQHPYVDAGLLRHVSDTLSLDDGIAFHDAHYAPDNATLVIAGRFDADLADRWIDYLFADWQGTAQLRESPRVHPQPASLARAADVSTVNLTIAIPAVSGNTATRHVAAAMLDQIAMDVRHQLGASYVIGAKLDESRLATAYVISGAVEAPRAKEALELIRSRIAQLEAGGDATAQAFVTARHRVYGHLLSLTGTAKELAERVERDVSLGRRPLTDVATAGQVRRTTIDDMAATLADLDLAHAAIEMRGPRAEVEAAFDALGRKPTFFAPDRAPPRTAAAEDSEEETNLAHVERTAVHPPAPPPSSLTIMLQPGYAFASPEIADATGLAFSADIGFNLNEHQAVGVHAGFAYVGGLFHPPTASADSRVPFDVVPIDLAAFARGMAYDRLWGAVYAGIHADFTQQLADSASDVGLCFGAAAGLELLHVGRDHVGVFISTETELGGDAGYGGETIGVTYRR
ncbi:MAG: insulinase family protein, partial [Acidobacteriota bacterium]